jgi:hypothetical protein
MTDRQLQEQMDILASMMRRYSYTEFAERDDCNDVFNRVRAELERRKDR